MILFLCSIASRPTGKYDEPGDHQPQQDTQSHALDQYSQDQSDDDRQPHGHLAPGFFGCVVHRSAEAFNAIKLASNRYAPGTPAGN